MSRLSTICLALVLFIGVTAWPASAATISGNTGLLNIPNADALRPSTMEIHGHMMEKNGWLGINMGIVPQIELGVNMSTRNNDLSIALKGVLSPETKQMPGIAAGLENDSMYVVISRTFSQVRGHVGIGNGRFGGPFVGLSMMLNKVSLSSTPVTTLLVEHDGHRLNAGARIAFTPQLKVDVAVIDMDELMLGFSLQTSL